MNKKLEMLELLEQAKEHMEQASDLLHQYVQATNDSNSEVYLVNHLDGLISEVNPYDMCMNKLIDQVLNGSCAGEDDEDNSTGKFKCYDCGSTLVGHHTPGCSFSDLGDVLDLEEVPGTQWWVGD